MPMTTSHTDSKPFVTWNEGGRQFLAAKNHSTFWFICDETGVFYGAHPDLGNFRKRFANNESLAVAVVTVVAIRGGRDPLTRNSLT